jgi:DNA-binding winged helix-turn-helix (wHTH) protein
MSFIINHDISFNVDKNTLEHIPSKEWVSLSLYQSHLLLIILKNKTEIMSRDRLINECWENHGIVLSGHTLSQYIGVLRRLFRNFGCDEFIITQPRVGFSLNPEISVIDNGGNMEKNKLSSPGKNKILLVAAPFAIFFIVFICYLTHSEQAMTYKFKNGDCNIEFLQNFSLQDQNEMINHIASLLSRNNLKCQGNRLIIYDSYKTPSVNGFKRDTLLYCKLTSEKKIVSCDSYYYKVVSHHV